MCPERNENILDITYNYRMHILVILLTAYRRRHGTIQFGNHESDKVVASYYLLRK